MKTKRCGGKRRKPRPRSSARSQVGQEAATTVVQTRSARRRREGGAVTQVASIAAKSRVPLKYIVVARFSLGTHRARDDSLVTHKEAQKPQTPSLNSACDYVCSPSSLRDILSSQSRLFRTLSSLSRKHVTDSIRCPSLSLGHLVLAASLRPGGEIHVKSLLGRLDPDFTAGHEVSLRISSTALGKTNLLRCHAVLAVHGLIKHLLRWVPILRRVRRALTHVHGRRSPEVLLPVHVAWEAVLWRRRARVMVRRRVVV